MILLILGHDVMLRVGIGDKDKRSDVSGALTVDSSSQITLDTDNVFVRSEFEDIMYQTSLCQITWAVFTFFRVVIVLSSKYSFLLVFHFSFDLAELRVVLVFDCVFPKFIKSHGILNCSHCAFDFIYFTYERTVILVVETELPQKSIIKESHFGDRVDLIMLLLAKSVRLNLILHVRHVETMGSNVLGCAGWGSTGSVREFEGKYIDVEGFLVPHFVNSVISELVMRPFFNGINRGDERLR